MYYKNINSSSYKSPSANLLMQHIFCAAALFVHFDVWFLPTGFLRCKYFDMRWLCFDNVSSLAIFAAVHSNKGRVREKSCMASKACSAIGWGCGHGGWPKDKLIYWKPVFFFFRNSGPFLHMLRVAYGPPGVGAVVSSISGTFGEE